MNELLERIATALETGNTLTQQWLDLNVQWRKENVERGEREAAIGQHWIEWQKQQKMEERAQIEHLEEVGIEKIITARKEQDEIMLALQREMLTGETHDDG
jgi:hypothetical protein